MGMKYGDVLSDFLERRVEKSWKLLQEVCYRDEMRLGYEVEGKMGEVKIGSQI